jgi:DNA-directed RNA polymerase subunit beta'
MIDAVYRACGQKETVIFCRPGHGLGFRQACKAGISFGKDDMVIPDTKKGWSMRPAIRSRSSNSSTMTA